jgi:hypothetical protein
LKVAIRRVGLASLGKFGCLLGLVAAFLPSLLCGLLGLGLAGLVRRWLETWQETTISLFGEEIARLDLVHLFGLDKFLGILQVLGLASAPALLLIILALSVVGGALLAAVVVLVGLVYNLLATATGGLVVEMASWDKREAAE